MANLVSDHTKLSQVSMILGAAVFGFLGSAHLIMTVFTNSFESRDSITNSKMKASTMVLTHETSMWKAWIGFNASHSLGIIWFSVIYAYLATNHLTVIHASPPLLWLPVFFSLSYLWLAWRYWFSRPFAGVLVALACFTVSALVGGPENKNISDL